MHTPPPGSGVHIMTPVGQLTTFSLKFCPDLAETLYYEESSRHFRQNRADSRNQ